LAADAGCDSGAVAEIVLAVARAVGELGQEILGLDGAECNVARECDIEAASGCGAKGGPRAEHDCI